MEERFAAHIREDGREQSVLEHARAVADLARAFAEPFGGGPCAGLLGWAHDIGKYGEGFQRRIHGSSRKADHSTAGARELAARFGAGGRMLAYAAGYHAGCPTAAPPPPRRRIPAFPDG